MGALPPGFTIDPPGYFPDPTRFRGGRMTSGRRTREGNAAVDGAEGSNHLDGNAADYIPLAGETLEQTLASAQGYFGPNARVAIHGGNHVHADLPGYGMTPYMGERGTLGIDSPLPSGFAVDEGLTDPEILLRQAQGGARGPAALASGSHGSGTVGAVSSVALGEASPAQSGPIAWDGAANLDPRQFNPLGGNGRLMDISELPEINMREVARPPVEGVRTITTRDDPRLAGVNSRVGAMYANGRPEGEIAEYLAGFGISPSQIPGWQAALAFRNTPDFARWRALPAGERPAMTINLDDIALPEPITVAQRETPLYTANARDYQPSPITDRAADAFRGAVTSITGDRSLGAEQGANMRSFLDAWWSPVPPAEWAMDAHQRAQLAMARGDVLGQTGNQIVAGGSAILAIPIIGRPTRTAAGVVNVIDDSLLREVARAADGSLDAERVGLVLEQQVRQALEAGGEVTLRAGNETRRIVEADQFGLVDEASQRWGGSSFFAGSNPEDRARLEIRMPEGAAQSDAAGGAAPTLEEFNREGNERFLLYTDPDGQEANIQVIMRGDGEAEISVDPFSRDANRFGPAAIRDAARQLGDLYPEIRTLYGVRESGAGPGRMQRIDLSAMLGRGAADADPLAAIGRPVDRIDLANNPPPQGFVVDGPGQVIPLGAARRPDDLPSAEALAAGARSIRPADLLPRPSNRVENLAEFDRANPGTVRPVEVPRPESFQAMRTYQHPINGKPVRFRGPLDVEAYLRTLGGIRDDGGELRHMGISNAARSHMKGENRLGPIITPGGMSVDEAGEALLSAGYFRERPTEAEVLEALRGGRFSREQATWNPDDLEELEAAGKAQDQVYAAQAAEQEGAPLGEMVGDPATLDDLRANEPPAMAYEDVAALADRVGGFNLARIGNGREIAQSIRAIDDAFGIRAGAAGRRSWAESQALADEMGVTLESILRSNSGQPLSDAEAIAYRAALAKAHQEMMAIARRIQSGRGSDVDRLLLDQAAQVVGAVQHKVTRRRAELARAMSVLRKTADPTTMRGPVIRRLIEAHGGPGRADNLARALVDAEQEGLSVGRINRLATTATKPGWQDMVAELNYASMLSAPSTQEVNAGGNSMALALSIPEYGLASAIGSARNLIRPTQDRIALAEVAAYVGGLGRGVRRGLRLMPRVFRTGEDVDHIAKIEARHQNAIPGPVGNLIRTPLRALTAVDALFKATTRTGTTSRLAWQMARKEGLTGEALARRADELFQNPTDEMIEEASDFARHMAFQDQPGFIGQAVLNVTNTVPLLKLKIPFVRTLGNLVKWSGRRSPAALLMPSVWRELKAGGARRDLALSRMAIGSVIGWSAMEAADSGLITGGGPLDYAERLRLEESGWQAYSIWTGDRYVSYRQLDPLATVVAVAADLATYQDYMTESEKDRGALILGQLIARNVSDSFWMEAVSELLGFLENPGQELPRTLGTIAGNLLVPNIIAQPLGSYDPVMRDQRPQGVSPRDLPEYLEYSWETIKNRVMARIPGLRDNLPARTNNMGEPIRNDGRAGPDFISPFRQRLPNNDAVVRSMIDNDLRVGRPDNDTEGRRHTAREQRELTELSGRYIREDYGRIIRTPAWRGMSGADRRDWFEDIKRDARRRAREELRLYPDMQGPAQGGGPSGSLPPGFVIEGAPLAANALAPAGSGPPAGFVLDQ